MAAAAAVEMTLLGLTDIVPASVPREVSQNRESFSNKYDGEYSSSDESHHYPELGLYREKRELILVPVAIEEDDEEDLYEYNFAS